MQGKKEISFILKIFQFSDLIGNFVSLMNHLFFGGSRFKHTSRFVFHIRKNGSRRDSNRRRSAYEVGFLTSNARHKQKHDHHRPKGYCRGKSESQITTLTIFQTIDFVDSDEKPLNFP